MHLSLHFRVRLYERESVIIFDEVEFFPQAREALKYLVKDGRYDYIETGSLISICRNTKRSSACLHSSSGPDSANMRVLSFGCRMRWL